jgi:hypothetical protein
MNAVQRYLDSVASLHKQMKPRGFRYASMFAFVLAEGMEFSTDNIAFPRTGALQQCFGNCFTMALRNPTRYVYCEGYASGIIPVNHAWLWDKANKRIIDPTWQDGQVYFGIPFNVSYCTPAMLATGSVIDDYKRGFPLLREEADPTEYLTPLE